MESEDRIKTALKTIKQWMLNHEAPLLFENLAEGSTKEQLD